MGIWTLSPGNGHHHSNSGAAQQQLLAYPNRQVALQKARELGCEGVHATGDLWMPCLELPTHSSTHPHRIMNSMRNLSLALILTLLAVPPAALACGGGGSGSYRKPPRPGQHQHQLSQLAPSPDKGSITPESAPQ